MITPLSLRYRKKCHVKTRRPHFCTDELYSFYHKFDRPGQNIFYTLSGVFSVHRQPLLDKFQENHTIRYRLGELHLVCDNDHGSSFFCQSKQLLMRNITDTNITFTLFSECNSRYHGKMRFLCQIHAELHTVLNLSIRNFSENVKRSIGSCNFKFQNILNVIFLHFCIIRPAGSGKRTLTIIIGINIAMEL